MRFSSSSGLLISSTVCLALCAADAPARRGIVPDDYYSMAAAADPQISPDGKLVAYTVATVDRKANRKLSQIWVASLEGRPEPRAFTQGDTASSPRWSPDGRSLAFISSRRDARTGNPQGAQVYLLSLSGGEARRVTELKNGVTAFQWSPDGRKLACVGRIGPGDSLPANANATRSDVRDYTFPAYKLDGRGFFDDRHEHIWVVDVATGAATQLTSGDDHNDTDPQWSPNGTHIAYFSQKTDQPFLVNGELNVIAANGGTPVQLSATGASMSNLQWSPDGRSLAFIGGVDETAIPKIWITSADGGKHRLLTAAVTYANHLKWSNKGDALFVTEAYHGEHPLLRVDVSSGKAATLIGGIDVLFNDINEEAGKIVYASSDAQHPADLYLANLDGKRVSQLTALNDKQLSGIALQPIEPLPYKASDGWDIEGFFVKPAGWQPGNTYPMILMIHGGPNGMYGSSWSLEAQAYAARGWAVLMTNPRGSSGYGEAFQRGVNLEWGGKAYTDIMSGVDAAIQKYPWIDANRLGVTGQSFGGFMTDWIVGQTTRFKGAVTLSGISDLISVEGTRDAYYGHDRDFGGDLWKNFDLYWKYSPIRNAARVKTPTLVLHGDADQRVPLSQGEEFFRALYHFGVPTELVVFPREPHSLRSEPKHAVEVLQWQIYWFDRYVAGNASAAKPNAQ